MEFPLTKLILKVFEEEDRYREALTNADEATSTYQLIMDNFPFTYEDMSLDAQREYEHGIPSIYE